MWTRPRKRSEQDLAIATFFRTRTVEEMAIVLAERERPESSPAPGEPTRDALPAPSVFWVDYVGELAQHLDDIPMLPLGFYTDEHLIWPYDSIEKRAAVYLERLREQQPKGPYRICGRCAGANIAFELARQLHAQGEEVPLLILISPRHANSASASRPRRLLSTPSAMTSIGCSTISTESGERR